MKAAVVGLIVCFAVFAPGAAAEELVKRPRVFVKQQAALRSDRVLLKDIASIVPGDFADLAAALAGVKIMDAPPPRVKQTVMGVKILEAIELAGIGKDSFGYSIPNVVTIEREGRQLTAEEVLSVVKDKVWKDKSLDVQPREVNWSNDQVIPAGRTRIEVESLGLPSGGRMPLRVEAFVEDKPAARFLATAIVDDWREVPVLKRPLDRGMLVSADDVELVRLNLYQQPADIVSEPGDLIGRRTKGRLGAGETVRRSNIDVPPLITKGRKVTLIYRVGVLTASATGVALEDGFEQGKVRVRNDTSKKIVTGKVTGPEEVLVSSQEG